MTRNNNNASLVSPRCRADYRGWRLHRASDQLHYHMWLYVPSKKAESQAGKLASFSVCARQAFTSLAWELERRGLAVV